MEKATRLATYFLFALTAFFPAASALTAVFGYKITLRYIPVFAMILAVLSAGSIMGHLIYKPKKMFVLTAVLALVSIVNAALLIFTCNTPTVIIGTLFSAICCCLLPAVHAKRLAVRITALVLSVLMLLPCCYCGFIFLIFGNIGQNTVVQSAVSPDGTLCAEVIDSDQGALGGNTLVQVRETYSFDAGIFEISKKAQRVYMGEWGEFKDMEIEWKYDNCLSVNGHEYAIQ
ncbi:MAG: hypothetical protein E7523_05505 [Ruminococcaceae bacterium]|nr:hypothetical protein [Oscillospiraceae bacterium]